MSVERWVKEDLEIDVANWKRRYEESKRLLAHGAATWEVTIRDRDHWKDRAEKAEALLEEIRALAARNNGPASATHYDLRALLERNPA
jgi:hypothetical protein